MKCTQILFKQKMKILQLQKLTQQQSSRSSASQQFAAVRLSATKKKKQLQSSKLCSYFAYILKKRRVERDLMINELYMYICNLCES